MTGMEILAKIARRRGTTPEELIKRSNEAKPEVTRDIDTDFEKLRYL